MGDSWSTVPFLGQGPHFHLDPVEGGAPVLSTDGHWWWDGRTWTPSGGLDQHRVGDRRLGR